MTYLQLINSVLRRLREDEVASASQSSYAKLIGDFVNETKREVEDAYNWSQLRTVIPITTAAADDSYTLTDSGSRSRLLQVVNATTQIDMHPVPYTTLNTWKSGSPTDSTPMYYNLQGSTGGDDDVILYPQPDAIETINFYVVKPQDDFTVDADVLTVPSWPVILGAYSKAISERGEDGGTQFAETMNNYSKAMSDAIAIDSQKYPDELIWEVI